MTPEQIEEVKAKLRSQIGDDVGHVYLPEVLYEGALKAILAQAEEIERLRAALDRVRRAWPLVRDTDCSGGDLYISIEEIDDTLNGEAARA